MTKEMLEALSPEEFKTLRSMMAAEENRRRGIYTISYESGHPVQTDSLGSRIELCGCDHHPQTPPCVGPTGEKLREPEEE